MNKLHIYSIRKHVKHLFLRALHIIWKSIKKYIGMIEAKFRRVVTSRVEVGGMQVVRGTREDSAMFLCSLRPGGRCMIFHVLFSWHGSIIL